MSVTVPGSPMTTGMCAITNAHILSGSMFIWSNFGTFCFSFSFILVQKDTRSQWLILLFVFYLMSGLLWSYLFSSIVCVCHEKYHKIFFRFMMIPFFFTLKTQLLAQFLINDCANLMSPPFYILRYYSYYHSPLNVINIYNFWC